MTMNQTCFSVISQAKVFVESQAAKRANCVQGAQVLVKLQKVGTVSFSVHCNVCMCSMIIV
jgi:hypothetical protein